MVDLWTAMIIANRRFRSMTAAMANKAQENACNADATQKGCPTLLRGKRIVRSDDITERTSECYS